MKIDYNKLITKTSTWLLIIFSIVLYIVFLLGSQDNDMFFEIVSGRDLLAGNFETASHLDNFPMTVQQWLYAVFLAIFDKLGYIGHILLVFIQDVILLLLSVIFIKMKSNHSIKMALIISFGALLFCSEYLINVRPQIITMILLLTELILLEQYIKHNQDIKYLFMIIPVLILSANFHQGIFLYHIMFLIPYYIKPSSKYYLDFKLLLTTPIYILCSLFTPYKLDGALYIFRTFLSKTYKLYSISELEPLSLSSFIGLKLAIIVIITIVLIYMHKSNYFINTYVFSIAILSLFSIRHVSVMYIPILFLICTLNINKLNSNYIKYGLTLLCIALSACLSNSAKNIIIEYGDIATIIEDKDAKIYNTAMDLGGFLEYNGYTKIKIDSRCDAFSKEISGVANVNTDLFALNRGYKLDKHFNAEFASNDYLLELIDEYDYVISGELDYVNRVLESNSKWDKIYSNNYIIWENTQ